MLCTKYSRLYRLVHMILCSLYARIHRGHIQKLDDILCVYITAKRIQKHKKQTSVLSALPCFKRPSLSYSELVVCGLPRCTTMSQNLLFSRQFSGGFAAEPTEALNLSFGRGRFLRAILALKRTRASFTPVG